MRKSLLLTVLLSLLLLSATAVSAQSLSAFGSVGWGTLNVTVDGNKLGTSEGDLALQAGMRYHWLDNVSVGLMYDKTTSRVREEDMSVSLVGYNALLEVDFDVVPADFDLGLVAGLGSYTLSASRGAHTDTLDPAFGYLVGANVKYDFGNDWSATGNVAYRTATFKDSVDIVVGGWSFGVGIVYEF